MTNKGDAVKNAASTAGQYALRIVFVLALLLAGLAVVDYMQGL